MRNGVEIWADGIKADGFGDDCVRGMKGMVKFEGRYLNTADFVGVFFPEDMESLIRKKNKQWKCKSGTWHDQLEKCNCPTAAEKELAKKRSEAIQKCGKCQNGWIQGETGVRPCDCVKDLINKI